MVASSSSSSSSSSKVQFNILETLPHHRTTVAASSRFKLFAEPPNPKRKSVPVSNAISQVNNIKDSKVKALDKLENNRRKQATSFTGRKALADISNVRRNFSSSETYDGSKPGMGKSVCAVFSQRASVGPGVSTSLRKLLMGKSRTRHIQATADAHNLRRVVAKESKDFPGGRNTKVEGERIASSVGRKSVRNGLAQTRTSLPVLKKVNGVDPTTSDLRKGKADKSEKGKGKFTFPVKPKVGGKAVPEVSNVPRHIWKNRNSDGFTKMSLRGQSNGDARASSTTLVKPTVKTTITTFRTQTSKSKLKSVPKKSEVGASISFRRKQTSAISVLSKETASVLPSEQPGREGLTSARNNENDTTTSHIINRGRGRRKSYTSLLIAGSKLIKECGTVTKQDFLPNIDDDSNQLEVAEYVDEIYQYYWVMEAQNRIPKNYMEIQRFITPQMRGILINWLLEVHLKFDLMQETLYLMVTLLDQYLSLVCIKKNEMQLVGLTALLLASKYEDFWHPKVTELISISAECYTKDQMLLMSVLSLSLSIVPLARLEQLMSPSDLGAINQAIACRFNSHHSCHWSHHLFFRFTPDKEEVSLLCNLTQERAILKKLKFRLNMPTPYVFMLRFLKAAQPDTKFKNLAFYLIELCLVEYEALNFKPSLLCASAIYVARHTLQITPTWTPLLDKHTRYEEYQLRDCAEMILRFHRAARTGVLKVTFEKYSSTDKSRVAAIEPLNMHIFDAAPLKRD